MGISFDPLAGGMHSFWESPWARKYDMQGNVVYNGRIPVASVGTTDMHSLTQEHQHGKKNKLIQFISVEHLPSDLSVLCDEKGVSGMVPMSRMLDAARKANEEAWQTKDA